MTEWWSDGKGIVDYSMEDRGPQVSVGTLRVQIRCFYTLCCSCWLFPLDFVFVIINQLPKSFFTLFVTPITLIPVCPLDRTPRTGAMNCGAVNEAAQDRAFGDDDGLLLCSIQCYWLSMVDYGFAFSVGYGCFGKFASSFLRRYLGFRI